MDCRVLELECSLFIMGRMGVLEEAKGVEKDRMGQVNGEMHVLFDKCMCCLLKVCAVC